MATKSGSERAAFDAVMEKLPAAKLKLAIDYLKWVQSDAAPPWWADCVCQTHTGRLHPYDGYIMLMLELDLALGQLAMARIHVGQGPAPDKEQDRNETTLRAAMPPGWSVDVGGYDSDGSIHWGDRRPDFVDLMTMSDPRMHPGAALEIGTTASHKTLLHLRRRGALARWPYGSEYLWIFEFRGNAWGPCPEQDDLERQRDADPLPRPAIVCAGLRIESQDSSCNTGEQG